MTRPASLLALAALALVLSGCAGSRGDLRISRSDRNVLDDEYTKILAGVPYTGHDGMPDLAVLNPGQRLLTVLFWVDEEIGNGGYYQLYWNVPGSWIAEAERAARTIGRPEYARLLQEAGALLFPGGVPDDVKAQREAIGCLKYCDKGRLDGLLAHWRGGSLRTPLRRYVDAHPRQFFLPRQ